MSARVSKVEAQVWGKLELGYTSSEGYVSSIQTAHLSWMQYIADRAIEALERLNAFASLYKFTSARGHGGFLYLDNNESETMCKKCFMEAVRDSKNIGIQFFS
ncbi:uncharacterized protein LOC120699422 [Panicum virgatum]|uniref:uncharacterized protein LOC120699422 n=1 Tax=Panicum virgatum TaxID=38727 RepID=UPI0019D6A511|nr:uncharacterized protein LOC120699422 [Panicum virgatum]